MKFIVLTLTLIGFTAWAEDTPPEWVRTNFWNAKWERVTVRLVHDIQEGLEMIDTFGQVPGEGLTNDIARSFAQLDLLANRLKTPTNATRLANVDQLVHSIFTGAFHKPMPSARQAELRREFIESIRAEVQPHRLAAHRAELERSWRIDDEGRLVAWAQGFAILSTVALVTGIIARWIDPANHAALIGLATVATVTAGGTLYWVHDRLPWTRQFRVHANYVSPKVTECADALIKADNDDLVEEPAVDGDESARRGPIYLSAGRLGPRSAGRGRGRQPPRKPGVY